MAYNAPAPNELTTSEPSGLPVSQYDDDVFAPYRRHIRQRIASNPGPQETVLAMFRSNWRSEPGSTTRHQKGCAISKFSKLENFTFKPAELNFGPVPMDSLYARSKGGGGLQGGAAVISDGVMRVLDLLQLEDRLPVQFWPSLDQSAASTPPGYRGYKLSFSSPEESSAYREPFKGCEWAAVAFCCYKSPPAIDPRAEKCPASIIIGKRWVDDADTLFVEFHGRCQHTEPATYGPYSYHHTPAKADSPTKPNSPTESEALSDADSNDVCEATDCSPQRALDNVINWISSFLYDIPTDAVRLVLQLAIRAGGRPVHQSALEARPSNVIAVVQRLNASQLQSFCREVLLVMSNSEAAPCSISHTLTAQNDPATARSVTQIEPAWPRKRKGVSQVEASSSGTQPLPMQPPGRYPKLSRSQCEVCSLALSRDCNTGLCNMCCKGGGGGHGRLDLPLQAPATMLGSLTDPVPTRNALDPVLVRRGLQQGQDPTDVTCALSALLSGASVQHQQLQGMMAPDHIAFSGLPGGGLQLMRQGFAVRQTTHNALLLPGASLQRQYEIMGGHNPIAAPPLGGSLQPGLSATFNEYALAAVPLAGSWQQVHGAPAGQNTLAVLLPGFGLQQRLDVAPGQTTLGAVLQGGGYPQGQGTVARPNTFAAVLTRGGWQQEKHVSAHHYPTAGLLPGSGWQLGQHVPAAQEVFPVMLPGNSQLRGQGLPAAGYNQMTSAVSGGGWQQQHQVQGITAVHSALAVSIPCGGYLHGQGGILTSGGDRGITVLPANGLQHGQQDTIAVQSAFAAALSGGRMQQGQGGMAGLNLAATFTLPKGGLQQGRGVRAGWNSLGTQQTGNCLQQRQHVVPRQVTLATALSGGGHQQGRGAMAGSNQIAAGLLSGGGWRGAGL